MSWRNRICGEALVAAAELLDNPANFRRHGDGQRMAMDGSLQELGWIQRVVVNRNTGRLIDGHLRAEIARREGQQIPVVYVDLTEEEERVALAVLDPIAAMADTVQAFRDAGLAYYNEAILVTQAGSLPIRAGRAFEASRKLGKTHQNVLVFVKGDPRRATEAVGAVEFGGLDPVSPPPAAAIRDQPRRSRRPRRGRLKSRPAVA